MRVTSSRTPTQHARRYRHPTMGSANTSAAGARNLLRVDGLACRTNHELTGAATTGSCNPATSGMPLTSKAVATPSWARTTPEQPTG